MSLLMGVDIGTTAVKAVVVDINGRKLTSAQYSYKLDIGSDGSVEQDGEEWWKALCTVSHKCLAQLREGDCQKPPGRVSALAFSTQGGSLIMTDKAGRPLAPAVSWMDMRPVSYLNSISEDPAFASVYNTTGWPLEGCLSFMQLIRIRDSEPELLKKAGYVLTTADFLALRMTENAAIDPSNAAMTQMFNIASADWEESFYNICGVNKNQLPDIVPSGKVIGKLVPEALEAMGLTGDVSLVSGGHDQYCGALGSGAVLPGDVAVSTGTAWVMVGIDSKPVFDDQESFRPGRHVLPGLWGALKSMGTGGACVEWSRRLSFSKEGHLEDYEMIEKEAEKCGIGADGIRFFPYLSGSYIPQNPINRAAFLGLAINHSRYHMYRAVMEGLAFELRRITEAYTQLSGQAAKRLILTGGATNSELFSGIITDVLGIPAWISGSDAACLGAAILAGMGSGQFRDANDALERFPTAAPVLPNKENMNSYNIIYKGYTDMVDVLYSEAN